MSERDTVMLEVFERLGSIDAKLEAGRQRHEQFAAEVRDIKSRIEPLQLVAETVRSMKPIVDDYARSRAKLAGMLLALSAVASGIGFFASELKAFLLGR